MRKNTAKKEKITRDRGTCARTNDPRLNRSKSGLYWPAIKNGRTSVVMKAAINDTPENALFDRTLPITLSYTLTIHVSNVTSAIVLAKLNTVIRRH